MRYDGDPTGFVQFGRAAEATVQPPADAYLVDGLGYDGQFYWALGRAPWIDERAGRVFAVAEYRAQRIAYPALAAAVSGGSGVAPSWGLLAVNVAFAALGAWAAAAWLRSLGRSGWLALAVGLTPGVMFALLRDLPDVVGLSSAIAGLYLWSARRPALAAAALVVAVLARETMLLAVAALAFDALLRDRRSEETTGAALAIGAPLLAFTAWQAYATAALDGVLPLGSGPGSLWSAPAVGLVEGLPEALGRPALEAGWSAVYIGLVLCAMAVALWLAWRQRTPVALLAAVFALMTLALGEVFWVEHWSFTRATAPLLAFLLLAGAAARSRAAVAIPSLAAGLTLLIPLAL